MVIFYFIYKKQFKNIVVMYIIEMRRKLSDDERKENRRKSYLKYRLTEKGRLAINRASLAYYHRNKAFRKNKVNKIENKKIDIENKNKLAVRNN